MLAATTPDDNPPRPIVVIGDANPDLVLRGDVRPRFGQIEQLTDAADLVLGGSGSITACGTARLGVPTSLVAAIGDDTFGRFVVDRLVEREVNVDGVVRRAEFPTGLSVILSAAVDRAAPGDRAILTNLGAIPMLGAADVVGRFGAPFHVHVSSFFLLPGLGDGLAEVFRQARHAGATTSLDTNWDPAEAWTGIREVLAYTDLFLPNDSELVAITGESEVLAAGARLAAATGATVVAKCGADGGHLWTPGGWHLHRRPRPTAVVDTTGAGDSFNAGYLAGFVRGYEPQTCLAMAVAAGSLSTRGPGGTTFQATWEELDTEMAAPVEAEIDPEVRDTVGAVERPTSDA